jgi:hypothetical protein
VSIGDGQPHGQGVEPVEPTLGQKRVRMSFNPSSNDRVDLIKEKAADLIDLMNGYSDQARDPELKRCLALAMTHIEDGAMWGVKGVTS